MKNLKKLLSLIAVFALVVGMLCACGKNETPDGDVAITFDTTQTTFGEGATAFAFEVTNVEGETKAFTVNTDETTVGAALLAIGMIDGEDSEYGMYVKTVAGITLDYDTDGKYWAFYVDGEYAMAGVDQTDIVAGSTYAFRAE